MQWIDDLVAGLPARDALADLPDDRRRRPSRRCGGRTPGGRRSATPTPARRARPRRCCSSRPRPSRARSPRTRRARAPRSPRAGRRRAGSPSRSSRITQAAIVSGSVPGSTSSSRDLRHVDWPSALEFSLAAPRRCSGGRETIRAAGRRPQRLRSASGAGARRRRAAASAAIEPERRAAPDRGHAGRELHASSTARG